MKKLPVILLLALFLCGCAGRALPQDAPGEDEEIELRILFINVGKADSALISFGDKHYLYDTGLAESFSKLVQVLRMNHVQALEGVFLSHTQKDHTGGLAGVLQAFEVKEIYAGNISKNKKDGTNVVDEIARGAGREVTKIVAGEEIILDEEHPHVKFRVLGPRKYFEDDNDNSLVLLLEYEPYTFLFTGDMQFDQEANLLEAGVVPKCTMMQVGNHGNPDASSRALIQAVSPRYAVVSTDSTVDTDTPNERVLEELEAVGAQVFVTQEADTGVLATLRVDGAVMQYLNEQPPEAARGIVVESLDKKSELLVLRNTATKAMDLGGWWVLSERGGEMFFFPEGTVLLPGKTISIASGKNPPQADVVWDHNNIWSNEKNDQAVLYDAMGNEVFKSPPN